ncbi:hypothetical protein MUP65_00990, partial [Patescibacteria group bacterium]|nr:hypothetical protein [Patescibacteria group bacterium]
MSGPEREVSPSFALPPLTGLSSQEHQIFSLADGQPFFIERQGERGDFFKASFNPGSEVLCQYFMYQIEFESGGLKVRDFYWWSQRNSTLTQELRMEGRDSLLHAKFASRYGERGWLLASSLVEMQTLDPSGGYELGRGRVCLSRTTGFEDNYWFERTRFQPVDADQLFVPENTNANLAMVTKANSLGGEVAIYPSRLGLEIPDWEVSWLAEAFSDVWKRAEDGQYRPIHHLDVSHGDARVSTANPERVF